jgi:hypothetical protein
MTAGIYPPGSDKGKSFLMDPKLLRDNKGKPETIAKIRLSFKSISDKVLMEERKFSLTATSKKMEF